MNKKRTLYALFFSLVLLLPGCSSLTVLNPKGPAARTLSDTIIFSILMMLGVLAVVYILYTVFLVKYRATKKNEGYVPPHEEGNVWLEALWIGVPIIIVAILSVVTVRSTAAVERVPDDYAHQEPIVIYAASSNWKWHFSYPEENIETVNYVNIPTHRPIEFRLYSYGPITSFWIPQLAGQKYAMSDMLTYLNLVADTQGSFMGRNSNFSGRGYAQMQFEALAMSEADYEEWVEEVQATAGELTEDRFKELLATDFVGRETYSNTHLDFYPPPMDHGDHGSDTGGDHMDHDDPNHIHPPADLDTEFDGDPSPDLTEDEDSENHSNHGGH